MNTTISRVDAPPTGWPTHDDGESVPMGESRTILVAIDSKNSSRSALEFAIDLAAEQRAHLIIVHVVPSLELIGTWDEDGGDAFVHQPTDHERALLDIAAEHAAGRGVSVTTGAWTGSFSGPGGPTGGSGGTGGNGEVGGDPVAAPEPGTLGLAALGLGLVLGGRRRRFGFARERR